MSMDKPVNPSGGEGDGCSKARMTFVQADSACFRDLVQRLTGPSGNQTSAPLKFAVSKPTQKLHDRRKCNKPKIEIKNRAEIQSEPFLQPKIPATSPVRCEGSPNGGNWAGPWSCQTSPHSIMLSSPLPSSFLASPISNPSLMPVWNSNKRASPSEMELLNSEEDLEERVVKEKPFYLHPSPRSKPRLAAEPELLTLFPLKSPTSSTASNEM